jgi:hypothetical protein
MGLASGPGFASYDLPIRRSTRNKWRMSALDPKRTLSAGIVVEAKRPPKQHSDDSPMCEKKKLSNANLRPLSSIRTTGLSHE